MHIVMPDDYQDVVRTLDCFPKLSHHTVTIYNDTVNSVDALTERFADADALVLIRERTAVTAELLEHLPKLKFISQSGRGTAHIDHDACQNRGITVMTTAGSPYSTAELTWALVLAGMRQLPQAVSAMQAGRWQTTFGYNLHGRTLGIFGYGNIGQLVASYGKTFGMRVLIWGREGSITRAQNDGFDTFSQQRDLFAHSDVVSLHIRLNAETRGIVTLDDLTAMKATALLVNTSRAGLIAPDALVNALKSGRPGYAAVDVYDDEPVTEHPLLHMPNVICTPHLGYVEKDNYEFYFATAFDNLLAAFAEMA